MAQPRPGVWPTTQNNLLYAGIYTETGRYFINNKPSEQYIVSTSFYAKIYSDKMIVTSNNNEQGFPSDVEYAYSGDREGNRVYSLPNELQYFIVDKNYDIMRVMEVFSLIYGPNVKDRYYYETVKGEHSQKYNKEHKMDVESLRRKLYGN